MAELSVRELLAILDEELQRLPQTYRLPLLLCCLEGRSLEDVARQLGWTPGSVKGRLERGRARLHDRLVRRGLTLSAALAAAEVSRAAATAALVAPLVAATVRDATLFATRSTAGSGAPTAAATLAAGVIKGMALARYKSVGVLLLAAGLLTGGWVLHQATSSPPTEVAQDRGALVADSPAGQLPDDPDAPIHVSGRVLDPHDGPIAGARLYVGFSAERTAPEVRFRPMAYPRRTTSATDGRFHFTFTQSELDAAALDHSRPAVIAVAEDYGPAWAIVKGSPADSQLSLKLPEDLPVEGRILGPEQQPVAGARVLVWEVADGSEQAFAQVFRGEGCLPTGKGCRGPLPEQPSFVTTTADGHFRLPGIGRDRIVTLVMEGAEVQRTFVWAATRPRPEARSPEQFSLASFNYVAAVSRRIRGSVRDKATGRPVAGVKVSARSSRFVGSFYPSLTDETGSYEVLVPPEPAGWMVQAQPESGQAYFAASTFVPDSLGLPGLSASTVGLAGSARGQGPFLAASALFPGRVDRSATDAIVVDFDLVSGLRLHGRIADQATGKPPLRTVVEYYPLFPNPHSSKLTNGPEIAASSCIAQADGSYGLVVLPGPGVVCAAASPRNWYAEAALDEKKLASLIEYRVGSDGGPGLRTAIGASKRGFLSVRKYNVFSLINPGEEAGLPALDLALQRARPNNGTVIAPKGQ
jgi:hypothetical protein